MYIPTHLQIEIVAGYCNAKCVMCTINEIPRRKIMGLTEYSEILDKFLEFREKIKFVTLHGVGEPLLDKTLTQKISLAKDKGFNGIGFATNAELLDEIKTEDLLDICLDTIIFSVDGITKNTHEKIRVGTDFDRIMKNALQFIKRRNQKGAKTKVIVRMIRQDSNRNEWDQYKEFWLRELNPDFGDQVAAFDLHNWGKMHEIDKERVEKLNEISKRHKIICHDLVERFIVLINGNVALCCGDEKGVHNLGNILYNDPLTINNGPMFSELRRKMAEGRLTEIDYCKNCQIILSRLERIFQNPPVSE